MAVVHVFSNVLLQLRCFTHTVPAPAGALSAQGPPKALHEPLLILAIWPGHAAPLSLAADRPPNSTLVWGELSIFYNDGSDPMTPIGGAATFKGSRMMARITGVDERRLIMYLVAVSALIRA